MEQLSLTDCSVKTPWKLQNWSGLNGPGLSLAELDGNARRDTEAWRRASARFHLPSGAFNAGLTALRAGPEPGRSLHLSSAGTSAAPGVTGQVRREGRGGNRRLGPAPDGTRHPGPEHRALFVPAPGLPLTASPAPGRAGPHHTGRRTRPAVLSRRPATVPSAHLRPAEPARSSALPPQQPPPRAHPAATGPRRRHLPSPACDLLRGAAQWRHSCAPPAATWPGRRSDGAERRHRDRRARIGREVNPHRAGLERHRRAPTARETVVRARPAGQAPSRPAPRNAPHRFSLTSLSRSKTQQGWLVFSSPKYKIPSDESAPPPPLAQQHPPFPPQEDFGGRLPPHSSSKRTPSNTAHPSIFCDGRVGWGLPSVSTAAEKETALLNCNVKKKTTTGELQLSLMGQFHHRSTSVGVRGVRGRRRGCWKGEILLTEKARVWHAEGFLKLVGKRVVGRRVKTQRSSCDFFFSYTVVLKTVRAPHSSYFSTVRISDTTLALGAQHSCVTE